VEDIRHITQPVEDISVPPTSLQNDAALLVRLHLDSLCPSWLNILKESLLVPSYLSFRSTAVHNKFKYSLCTRKVDHPSSGSRVYQQQPYGPSNTEFIFSRDELHD
jgi:hypothetical protein